MPYIYDTGPTAFLPFRRKLYSGFLHSEKNPLTLAGFEPANLGSSDKYDNHGTTGGQFQQQMWARYFWILESHGWNLADTHIIGLVCQPATNLEHNKQYAVYNTVH